MPLEKFDLPRYKIITKLRVFDKNRNWDDDSYTEQLYEEHIEKLKVFGLEQYSNVLCHFFNSVFYDEETEEYTIDEAWQHLASKDGIDMVQYENGNYGFIAYYNGHINGFEIIG